MGAVGVAIAGPARTLAEKMARHFSAVAVCVAITAAACLLAEAAPVANEELAFFAEPPFAPLPGDNAWVEETDDEAEAQELLNFVQGGPSSVSLFQHCSYRGKSRHVSKPSVLDIHTLGLPNDQLSSVKVPKGFCLTMFEHAKFKGRFLKVNGPANIKCLTSYKISGKKSWNDQVSSLKVTKCRTLTKKQKKKNIKNEAKSEVKQAAKSKDATGNDKHLASGNSVKSGLRAISHAALHGTKNNDGKITMGKASAKSAAHNQAKALGLPSVHPVDDKDDLKKNKNIDGTTKHVDHTKHGYTSQDAGIGPRGHYHLGRRRRRIGAGFGRRRAPAHVVVGAMPKFLKKGTAKLGIKKNPHCLKMKLKYTKKFPYCKKLKCYNYILLKHMKKKCKANKKCQGFTFSADADKMHGAGNGCLMAPPCRFFGHVSYDYYAKDWTCSKHKHLHVKDLLPKKKKKKAKKAPKHPKTGPLKEHLEKAKEKAKKAAKRFRAHRHSDHSGMPPRHAPGGSGSGSGVGYDHYQNSQGISGTHVASGRTGYGASSYGATGTNTRVVHIRCAECVSKEYNLCGTMAACNSCKVCGNKMAKIHLGRGSGGVSTAIHKAGVSTTKSKKEKTTAHSRAAAKPLKYGNPKNSKNDPHLKKHGKHKSWGGVRL